MPDFFEPVVNAAGRVFEFFWPVQEISPEPSKVNTFWQGIKDAQTTMALEATKETFQPVNLLPVIVGAIAAAFVMLRK